MTPLQAALLGFIQGIAEWLPVSSSAHLQIVRRWIGAPANGGEVAFTLFLHLATLAVGVWLFRRDLQLLATARRREALWMILATVPAAAAGVLLKDSIEARFASATSTGAALVATGGLLLAAHWFAAGSRPVGADYEKAHGAFPRGLPPPAGAAVKGGSREIPSHLAAMAGIDPEEESSEAEIDGVSSEEAVSAGGGTEAPLARRAPADEPGHGTPAPHEGSSGEEDSPDPIPRIADGPWPSPAQVIIIGFAQVAALFPGISRSGSTLAAGLFAGVKPPQAVPYVFLLGLPITAGAIVAKARDCAQSSVTIEPISWIVGFVVAAGVSLVVAGPCLRFLARGGLGAVGVYCIVAGGAVCAAAASGAW